MGLTALPQGTFFEKKSVECFANLYSSPWPMTRKNFWPSYFSYVLLFSLKFHKKEKENNAKSVGIFACSHSTRKSLKLFTPIRLVDFWANRTTRDCSCIQYMYIWSKLYIPSTLNTDYLLWHTQLIVCAVKI